MSPPGCKYYFDRKGNKNVYTNSDEPPEFPGGAAAFQRFLNKNLRYPESKGEDLEDLQTKTTIQFIVDTDGTLRNICVDKIENEPPTAFENEVISVIKKMPNWIPGKCKHKIIAVLHKLPIQVELERE